MLCEFKEFVYQNDLRFGFDVRYNLERQKYNEHSFLSQSRKWYTDEGETEDDAE